MSLKNEPGNDNEYEKYTKVAVGESTTKWGGSVGGKKATTNHEYDSFPVNTNIDPENQGRFGGGKVKKP